MLRSHQEHHLTCVNEYLSNNTAFLRAKIAGSREPTLARFDTVIAFAYYISPSIVTIHIASLDPYLPFAGSGRSIANFVA